MTYHTRDGRPLVNGHDMNTSGRGSTSRADTAGGQDPTDTASRNHAAMRQRQIAESAAAVSHNDVMAEHYAERAIKRDAENRERATDEFMRKRRDSTWQAVKEWEIESRNSEPFYSEDDPRWFSREDFDQDHAAWQERRDRYEAKLVGDDLATRITNRKYHH
ncbi:hypothetical protein [Streptomyces subrutilus]|uniref:hypothetical protein n=1 Tax=Streptomyces subrutilus TaxID=36818 RepID=UPI002E14E2AC|nr:hypothetical protein OG479_19285 [Streptomyces subrutilus]